MKTKKYETIGKYKWVRDCLITESVSTKKTASGLYKKRFSVEIDKKGIFKIYEGRFTKQSNDHLIPDVITGARHLKSIIGGLK